MVGSLGDDGGASALVMLAEEMVGAVDQDSAVEAVVRHTRHWFGAEVAALTTSGPRGERVVLASSHESGAHAAVPDPATAAGPVRLAPLLELSERAVVLELHGVDDTHPIASLAALVGLLLRQLDRIGNLTAALESRALIGQAQGIAMARYGLNGDQAMAYLRRTSQQSNVKVRDLAAEIVARADRVGQDGT